MKFGRRSHPKNAIVRLLAGIWFRTHTTLVIEQLHWLLVCFLVQFRMLTLTFKALMTWLQILARQFHSLQTLLDVNISRYGLLGSFITLRKTQGLVAQERDPRLWSSLPTKIYLAPFCLCWRYTSLSWLLTLKLYVFGTHPVLVICLNCFECCILNCWDLSSDLNVKTIINQNKIMIIKR